MDPKNARIALFFCVAAILGQQAYSFFQNSSRQDHAAQAGAVENADGVLRRFVLSCWVPDGNILKRADELYEIVPDTQLNANGRSTATYNLPGNTGSVVITHDSNLSGCTVISNVPFPEMVEAAQDYFISDPKIPGGTLFDSEDIDAQKAAGHVSWAADMASGARREGVSVTSHPSATGFPVGVLTWTYVDLS